MGETREGGGLQSDNHKRIEWPFWLSGDTQSDPLVPARWFQGTDGAQFVVAEGGGWGWEDLEALDAELRLTMPCSFSEVKWVESTVKYMQMLR